MRVGGIVKVIARVKTTLCLVLSVCIVAFAVFCIGNRVNSFSGFDDSVTLMAAFCMMPNADVSADEEQEKSVETKPKSNSTTKKTDSKKVVDTTTKTDEKTYKISEINIGSGNLSYDNISINNSTSYDMDVETLISEELGFEFEDIRRAQVLIVHTHTCESYMSEDSGYYTESFYPRTTDNNSNVVAVGQAIADSLKAHDIGVVHAVTQHDNPSYNGAYDRSYATIMEYLDKYSEIKVVLDIHRDSMTTDDMTKLKPTFDYDGKKAAQIMIMSGHDDGDNEFPTWKQNLSFALKLQSACETMYPGMTRPLNFGDYTYNMNVNSGSLLIEVGTDANTIDEAILSGEMLGNALSQVLQK